MFAVVQAVLDMHDNDNKLTVYIDHENLTSILKLGDETGKQYRRDRLRNWIDILSDFQYEINYGLIFCPDLISILYF